jgi:hypothetical protein
MTIIMWMFNYHIRYTHILHLHEIKTTKILGHLALEQGRHILKMFKLNVCIDIFCKY